MENTVSIIATSQGGANFEPLEAGVYPARCYSMIHMGTIKESFNGEDKLMNKVRLTFELPTEMEVFKEENGPQPKVLSKEFTLSLSDKANLLAFLNSWRGKALTDDERKSFDITVLVGATCMLTISHKTSKQGKTYAEISGIGKLMKGMVIDEQINPSVIFSVNSFNPELFDKFPDFLKEKIQSSVEFQAQMNVGANVPEVVNHVSNPLPVEEADDLPF